MVIESIQYRVNLTDFEATLAHSNPPEGIPPLLTSLWWEGKGDWSRAHEIAQGDSSANAAWVHAYLHRKEEDAWNAGYWYRRAHRQPSTLSVAEEWKEIVAALLATNPDS